MKAASSALAAFWLARGAELRAAYRASVAATLADLMPAIERGDLSDLGDDCTFLPAGARLPPAPAAWVDHDGYTLLDDGTYYEIDPGICFLEAVVGELPLCTVPELALLVLAVSPHAATMDREVLEQTHEVQAAHCLALDVRHAYRSGHTAEAVCKPRRRPEPPPQRAKPLQKRKGRPSDPSPCCGFRSDIDFTSLDQDVQRLRCSRCGQPWTRRLSGPRLYAVPMTPEGQA